MDCIYSLPRGEKKQWQLAILPKRKLFASSLSQKREDMISLNIYLLNPLRALNISSPRHLVNRHRCENDHDLMSYTPLIPQLNLLIWLLPFSHPIPWIFVWKLHAQIKINISSPCHGEAYFLIRERRHQVVYIYLFMWTSEQHQQEAQGEGGGSVSWLVLREQVAKVGERLWEPCLCLKGEEGCGEWFLKFNYLKIVGKRKQGSHIGIKDLEMKVGKSHAPDKLSQAVIST